MKTKVLLKSLLAVTLCGVLVFATFTVLSTAPSVAEAQASYGQTFYPNYYPAANTSYLVRAVPNNSWSVIKPIIEAGLNNPASKTTSAEMGLNIGFRINASENGKAYNGAFSASTLAQMTFNPTTQARDKVSSNTNLSLVVDPSFASELYLPASNINVGVEVREFPTTNNRREYYFRVTSMTPQLYTMLDKAGAFGTGKNKFALNTWYKLADNSVYTKTIVPKVPMTKNESMQVTMALSEVIFSNVTLKQDFGTDNSTLTPTRHVKLGLTVDGIVNMYESFALMAKKQVSAADIKEIRDSFGDPEVTKILDNLEADVWLGLNDARLYRTDVVLKPVTFSESYTSPSYNGTPAQTYSSSVTFSGQASVDIKSMNKNLTITKPTKFTDLQKMIDAAKAEAKKKGKDAAIKSGMSNLRASAELYYANEGNYGNNTMTMCGASGTTFGYTYADVQRSTGPNATWCGAWGDKYLVVAKLDTGRFWCVDYTGNSMETKTNRALVNTWTCK